MVKLKDYVFIIFNVPSLEEFLQNLTERYFVTLMDILDNELQKKNTRNLPYGYYTDENGELKVDIRAAQEVRKIYDMYIETQSIRDIAAELRTNFSDIREILHDSEEYMQMKNKIVSMAKLKRVTELMAANVRGGAVAKYDTEDEIADARRRRKESKKRLEQKQQMQ
jgi:D-ribose pyranose/furanose isomerase RbsD